MNFSVAKQEFARLGGMSRKPDALQKLIIKFVKEKPQIMPGEVLAKLKRMVRGGIIDDDADSNSGEEPEIHFQNHDGRSKSVPVSGLKHRLPRARKL